MSHWIQAKEALEYPEVRSFVRWCLQEAFTEGYGFDDPDYPKNGPCVEVFVRKSTSRQCMMFRTAMRVLAIDCQRGCGVTWLISADFQAAIRDFKKHIQDISGIAPDYDKSTN